MQNTHKYQAYTAATATAPKTKQIVLLYDGVIRLVQQGREAIREKRIEDRFNLLTKASKIINGMQNCLDFEKGGDIARILYAFYNSVDNRLHALHRSNSLEGCDEVLADLKRMRDAWQEIDERTDNNAIKAAATAGTTPDQSTVVT